MGQVLFRAKIVTENSRFFFLEKFAFELLNSSVYIISKNEYAKKLLNNMPFTKKIIHRMIHEIVICLKEIVSTWPYRNSVKLRSKQSKQYVKV